MLPSPNLPSRDIRQGISCTLQVRTTVPGSLYFFLFFIFIFLAVLGFHCSTWAFSSCSEQGLLFVAAHGLLIAVASHCGARALGAWASVVVAHGLSGGARALERRLNSCGTRA